MNLVKALVKINIIFGQTVNLSKSHWCNTIDLAHVSYAEKKSKHST